MRVLPKDLGSATLDAVTAVLEKMYIDRVIKDVGLAVTIYDIQSVEGGFVYHSDGAAHFTVRFTLVVFRPLIGGVLAGKVKTCTRSALTVFPCGNFDQFNCDTRCRHMASSSIKNMG